MKRFWRAALRPMITVVEGTSAAVCIARMDMRKMNMVEKER